MPQPMRVRYLTLDFLNNYFLFKVSKVLLFERTRFQTLEILESPEFGLCLLLDGLIQVAEYDEYKYHETLVHTPLLNIEQRKRIAILGGGDGCALREVLKYNDVERVDLVDIDKRVVEISSKYLSKINKSSLRSRKARLFFTDARKFISGKKNAYDSIIIDLTDPIEGSPSVLLYSVEFYRNVYEALKPGGSFITQATTLQSLQFRRIFWTVKQVFRDAVPLHVYMKTFCDDWGFVMSFKPWNGLRLPPDNVKEVEDRISKMIHGELKYLNGRTYLSNFIIPPEEIKTLMKPAKEIRDKEALKKTSGKEEESADITWVF